jgi:hypothetical protein
MNTKNLTELKHNDQLRKRLAKWMAHFCFRDTKLEQFHNRFTDDDMKELMIDCADHCYALVCMLFATESGDQLIEMLKEHDEVAHWDDPEMPAALIEGANTFLFRTQTRPCKRVINIGLHFCRAAISF